jgi:hypothetical protein
MGIESVRAAVLRSPEELDAYGELIYAIHSRLRDFIRNGGHRNFSQWVEQTWIGTLKLDAAHLIVDNDLAIDDKAISEAKHNRIEECATLSLERHRALIWLVEWGGVYSETPIDA